MSVCKDHADGRGWGIRRRTRIKRGKRRLERRRARLDPECLATYTRYRGYLL